MSGNYAPNYTDSKALVIGINDYAHASPLGYAVKDATAVAATLKAAFGFPEQNVRLLLNAEATREAINRAFLSFSQSGTVPDDRLVVFFAGHGHTVKGFRGENGYFVPQDGDPSNLATLIRWDEFTRNADLIQAKHILFVMDACFSGLIIQRLAPGTKRFVEENLSRRARQVITAGKADETVADSGGPRQGHSIFTGHLLDALEGAASAEDGVLTANNIMSYVYDKVGKDQYSRQTPDFGCIEGDGDLVFRFPEAHFNEIKPKASTPHSYTAVTSGPDTNQDYPLDLIQETKKLLSAPNSQIRLFDLADRLLKDHSSRLETENLWMHGPNPSMEEHLRRFGIYEDSVRNLQLVAILIAHWGKSDYVPVLTRTFFRLAEMAPPRHGHHTLLALGIYPLYILYYSAGIAALANDQHATLAQLFNLQMKDPAPSDDRNPLPIFLEKEIIKLTRAKIFKGIPDYEKYYAPKSEYLFNHLKAVFDELFQLGRGYEDYFDRFETFHALTHALIRDGQGKSFWGPPGRFCWKLRDSSGNDPFNELVEEAERYGEHWPLLQAGLFNSSYDQFVKTAAKYKQFIKELKWL